MHIWNEFLRQQRTCKPLADDVAERAPKHSLSTHTLYSKRDAAAVSAAAEDQKFTAGCIL